MKSPEELLKELQELQQDYDSLKTAFDHYITEHNRNIEILRESEEKYRMLIENLNEIIYTLDQNATITYISPNIKAIGGYSPAEIIGRRFTDFVHPEDLAGRLEQFGKILSGVNEPSEYRMLTRDGRSVWVRTSARLFMKEGGEIGVQGVLTDITDLKESEKRLNMLISQTPAIIYSYKIIKGELHLTYVNENVKNILGFAPEELIGNTELWYSCLHPDDHGIAEQTIKSNLEIKDSYSEYRFRDKSGIYHWLHDKQKVTRNEEGDIEVIGASWDISERKRMEEELIRARNRAEESTRLKSIFLANLSHEIRTPMNGILGFAELLETSKLNQKSRKNYINIIIESGERMLETINHLMDISEIEAGEIKIMNSVINICEQVKYICEFFKPETEKKGIAFSCKTNVPGDLVAITDREKLNAVLTNLVKNAIKYTDHGSVEFGCNIENSELLFFVKDTGIGISQEKHKVIFERFRQADESHTRNYEGIGLGLPIAKAYIEMLGGKIWVESEKEKGSVFYFTLPLGENPGVVSPEEKIQEETELPEKYDFSGITILIAEDEKDIQTYLQDIMKSTNAKIIMAGNGKEAINILEKNPDIKIALLDIKMPVMDGLEAARIIKSKYRNLPLIAQTAYSQNIEKKMASEAGFDAFISKPLNRAKLFKIIKNHLS